MTAAAAAARSLVNPRKFGSPQADTKQSSRLAVRAQTAQPYRTHRRGR